VAGLLAAALLAALSAAAAEPRRDPRPAAGSTEAAAGSPSGGKKAKDVFAELKPLIGSWTAQFKCGPSVGSASIEMRRKPDAVAFEYESKVRIPDRMRFTRGRISGLITYAGRPRRYRFRLYRHEYKPEGDLIGGDLELSADKKRLEFVTDEWPAPANGRWGFTGEALIQMAGRALEYQSQATIPDNRKECAGTLTKIVSR
jgi:hypothetical protein